MTTRERFAQNLKNLRTHTGKTQQEVADALGVKRGSYSGYENGAAEPNYELLVAISAYYKMSLETLLRREVTLASKLDHLYQDGSRLMVGMRVHG
mgnify:FL=1